MNRKFIAVIIAMLGLIYYSCGKPSEIADKVMIHAIGIDNAEEGYKVTMQVFSPEGGGADSPIDPSEPNVTLVKGNGRTVSDAVLECKLKLGGDVFLGQNRIILFGRKVDLSRNDELFGYFMLSGDAFMNVNCACAENTAEELLSLPLDSGSVASERFTRMINSGENAGTCSACSLTELMLSMRESSQTVILPEFTEKKNKSEKNRLKSRSPIAIEHGALYRHGKYERDISCEDMALCAMIAGTGDHVRIDDNSEINKSPSFRINARSISAAKNDDGIVFTISCRAVPDELRHSMTAEQSERENRRSAKLITEKAQHMADILCASGHCEVIGAARYLRRYYPSLYNRYKIDITSPEEHISIKVEVY